MSGMDQGEATGSQSAEKVTPASEDADLAAAAACVMSLVDSGIPSDTIELLVYGSKRQGVPPAALTRAIRATINSYLNFRVEASGLSDHQSDASPETRR